MGILSGKQLEDFHRKFHDDLNNKLNEIDEKYKFIDNKQDVTNTDLQAAILMHLRQERQEKLDRLIAEQAKDAWDNMTQQERFVDAANNLYGKTPFPKENDTYISNETANLCDALYGK